MKKLVAILLSVSLFLCAFPIFSANAAEDIQVYIDGTLIQLPTPPINVNGTTLVPMRPLFEALGATVDWDNEVRTAYGSALGVYVVITIDDPIMLRNFVEVKLAEPARIINGNTMIPLRAVSECFGMQVAWDSISNSIFLTNLHTLNLTDWNDYYYYYGEEQPGYGILYLKDTYQPDTYGYFENGTLKKGAYFYSDGSSYIGECKDGLRDGEGTIFFANGDSYSGHWQNNKPNRQWKVLLG